MLSEHNHVFPFGLLTDSDPAPVGIEGRGASRFIITCDHADQLVPINVDLGVSDADLNRHIGIDIGALGVARAITEHVSGTLIFQRYSRLVVDCNRAPSAPTAFPVMVDETEIPGNETMTMRQCAARISEIWHPYHAAITSALDAQHAKGITPILVAMHSFTPVHHDFPAPRPWPVSVLYGVDPSLSLALSRHLKDEGWLVGENEPYQVGPIGDYTVPVHGETRGIPHTLIEVRQDGILTEDDQHAWGARLAAGLMAVEGTLS
ncbi:MAG: N-formylglutamate amidohydrolase [Pseudomonadota bacterium]